MEKIRLQKLLSQAGIASRRKAEELILDKRVTINSNVALLGDKATFSDKVLVDNLPIFKEEKIYYLLNKPKKVVCTLKDNFNRLIITDLIINKKHKIFPVGRLDYDTTGVIILTNDGELANRLTHPSYQIIKKYEAKINKELDLKELKFLNSDNVKINNKNVKQEILFIKKNTYFITLKEGSYHHVKKLFETVNAEVQNLKRIEFAFLNVKNMPLGSYRLLKHKEIIKLKQIVKLIN